MGNCSLCIGAPISCNAEGAIVAVFGWSCGKKIGSWQGSDADLIWSQPGISSQGRLGPTEILGFQSKKALFQT